MGRDAMAADRIWRWGSNIQRCDEVGNDYARGPLSRRRAGEDYSRRADRCYNDDKLIDDALPERMHTHGVLVDKAERIGENGKAAVSD